MTVPAAAAGSEAPQEVQVRYGTATGRWVLLATILIWLPVLAYLLFGDWAVAKLDGAMAWLAGHRRPATFYALVIVSAALVIHAVALLV